LSDRLEAPKHVVQEDDGLSEVESHQSFDSHKQLSGRDGPQEPENKDKDKNECNHSIKAK